MQRLSTSGALAAAALVVAGGTAATIAWWYNLSNTRHALDFWGPRAVALIRDAPRVTVRQVSFSLAEQAAPATGDQGRVQPADGSVPAAPSAEAGRDISQAKGLVHLRHALLDDRSFAWNEVPAALDRLPYLVTFQRGESRLDVYFSSDFTHLATAAQGQDMPHAQRQYKTASTRPIAKGLRQYFAGVFRQP